jgi:anaerobic magnesium-protoporphyrin IX monomethyl ester cyclase
MILLMTTAPPANSPWGNANKIPPLGLAYIGAVLEKEGFKVEILDNYMLDKPIEEVKLEVKRLMPEIVGIGCSSNTYQRCVETAKAVKEVLPSCTVVVGGPHPSFMPESMLQHPEIDYAVMGEGERAMAEIAENIRKGEKDSIQSIPSVASRREGKIVKNPQLFIKDLDKVPFPARHLLPMQMYDREIDYLSVKPVDTMNVIRGCPYNCNWCNVKGLWGNTCRAFSPARVVAEIEHLVENLGTRGIYFVGDNFTINKERTVQLCQLMRQHKLDIEWTCDTGVDQISRELLREMKAAGCRTIWFGVESGSPAVLREINRGITLQQVENTFRLCREERVKTAVSFMLGIPGETAKDMKDTFRFARKIDPDWCHFNIFIAYPGCYLYDEILQKGLYDRLEDFLAYVKTKDFNYESLLETQRRFHKSFNKSPKRILRKVRQEGALKVLKQSLQISR